MDEAAARSWLTSTFDVPRETEERVEAFLELLRRENELQNLVSRSTLDEPWNRHIADSAQLLLHVPDTASTWLDLGTGAGFPGLVVGLLFRGSVTMVEERTKRVDFLRWGASLLSLSDKTRIIHSRAETFDGPTFDVISARAFAPLDRLLAVGARFATAKTRWVLPKGRNAKSELEAVKASWQGNFRLAPSLTDLDSAIVVAEEVRRRAKGKHR